MGIFPKLKERNSLSIADAQGKTPVRNADWNQYDCPEELSRYPESAQGAVEKDAPAGEESGYNGPTEHYGQSTDHYGSTVQEENPVTHVPLPPTEEEVTQLSQLSCFMLI